MQTLENAILIALQAHKGKSDKAGEPYILHPLRMMLRLGSETEKIVGVLHDIIEDSDYELEQLQKMGYSKEVLSALDCLTRRDFEDYDTYIERVRLDPIAISVKIADLEDNMDMSRIPNPNKQDLERLAKYKKAWKYLKTIHNKKSELH